MNINEEDDMAELELLAHYKKMSERNIVLDFQGAISQDMLVGMAELIRNKLSQEFGKSNIVKKIFSVFVEMAQNIAFYSRERVNMSNQEESVGAGIIVLTEGEGSVFTVTSGNLVKKDSVPGIIERCRKINGMDREELKNYYKEQLRLKREKGKRGAGVGLIDIARRSGHPIQYGVTAVDGDSSFLVLSVKIREENNNG